MNYKNLSKIISYALRHVPEKFDLDIDHQGWVKIDKLLFSLNKTDKWKDVQLNDIEHVIKDTDKKRFEIVDDKIRAVYGHSLSDKIEMEKSEPPDILYHGTARRFIKSIKAKGLEPKGRQYVHLSSDEETAVQVGKRRDENPIILKVKAKEAWNHGLNFYHGNEKIWLSDSISNEYIVF